jgi:hypothetical protein
MTKKTLILVAAVLVCSLILAGSVLAANGFAIPRSVIGGGGQKLKGSGYVLNGTVGEPIASDLTVGHTGPGHSSGFWWPPGYEVYLPLVVRQ